MKRLILSLLAVTVFFLGIGSLVQQTGAKFKSDDKALALIAKARQAIGGDAAINNVQSLTILGRTTRTLKSKDGAVRQEDGETEIAMQFPDKLMRKVNLGDGKGETQLGHEMNVIVMGEPKDEMKVRVDATAGEPSIHKKIVIKKDDGTEQILTDADADRWIAEHPGVPGEKRVIIKKTDGTVEDSHGELPEKMLLRRGDGDATVTTKDGKTFDIRVAHDGERMPRHNDMLRFALGLLLTSPKGIDVEYTSGGEASIEGTNCNVVNASFAGQTYRLFLDAVSNLPVAMNYTGMKMPHVMRFDTAKVGAPADGGKDVVFFKHEPEMAEFQVRFSDYRSVNGVQLPFRWVQTVGGAADETFDVTSFEINPANISEKFQGMPKGVRRMKTTEVQ